MIDRVIQWCVVNRVLVIVLSVATAVCGMWALPRTPLDAVPDTSDVQIVIATDWPGRSPDLIEDQITYPIVATLVSAPRVKAVRGVTEFGVSYVSVVFDDDTDRYWARARVLEALQGIREALPDNVAPTIGPDASAVGWILQYALIDESGGRTLDELRSLQDWTVRYALASVPGVAEVATIGGFVKQYQVTLDPQRLRAFNLSPKEIVDAIRASDGDASGRLIELAGREYTVRMKGRLASIHDIEQISLRGDDKGTPVRVVDVARVQLGPDLRRGAAELDGGGQVVSGIVVMRTSENALDVLERVKSRLADLQSTLPKGVQLVTAYDRTGLIQASLATLRRSILEEALLVALVIVAFLSHWRSALIPLLVIPLAVVATFIPLWYFAQTANIMSLGGIALAIGVLADASIVVVENGYRRLTEEHSRHEREGRLEVLVAAARQVGRPVFFCALATIASFLPVFLLQAEEGRMFRPLALTKTLTMVGASLLAVTLVPALMAVLLGRGSFVAVSANALTRFCTNVYEPILRVALRRKWTALTVNLAVIPLTVPLLLFMGHEFMPPLYEGSVLYMPTAAPGVSMTEATQLLQRQDRVVRSFPEVERVLGTVGRANTVTDNSPSGMFNTLITLKPREQWRPGMTFARLQSEMDRALQFPGVPNAWTQPIRGRLDMLSSGMKTSVGLKVVGNELSVLQDLGLRAEAILRGVPGTRNVYAERLAEGYYTDIRIDRDAIARFGVTVKDVEDVLQSAVGGDSVGRVVEGRERYPISVRYARDFRSDVAALENVLVKTSTGAQVPLSRLASVALTTGPAMIRNENGRLAAYVYIDTDDRDVGAFVARAQQALSARLQRPPGYLLEWDGQYRSQIRAGERLRLLIPLVIVSIFAILYLIFHSAGEALTVMLSVVYAMSGGVFLQFLLGYNFSVAAWVGYIALFGVAVQTGVVMVVYLHEALEERRRTEMSLSEHDIYEAVVAGAVLRLRPKLMTVIATLGGLLPILWSSGVGSDVLKPIAAPIAGGMITSAVHVLIITPVIFFIMKKRALVAAV
ncbi:MAG TPA: CusA/CzcA family heavy metal efflux RND transporter [Vicinamibacterales bacterium]|nr:CusA/CzcA family heavy metal efflux RND transporter [Vicinamibacterales bacterium]